MTPAAAQASAYDPAPFGDRGGDLVVDIGHTQATADRHFGEVVSGGDLTDHTGGLTERTDSEDLAPDVCMDAEHVDRGRHLGPLDRPFSPAVGDGEPELGVVLAGGDVVVGFGLDTGREAQQDLRRHAGLGEQHVEAVELVETVDDDATDAGLDRHTQLGERLVVAVEHEPLGRNAGVERNMKFAAGGDVEVHALLVSEAGHRCAQERLGGVGDAVTEGLDGLAATVAQVLFVVDEDGRAELGGEIERVAATDVEHTLDDLGGLGRPPRKGRMSGSPDHIDSGAETPSRFRAIWRPTWLAATKARRAWVSSGATPSPIT